MMNGWDAAGRYLMLTGCLLLLIGIFFYLGGRLLWFGRLPGDITIRKGNFQFYFPLATCLLLSLLLSLLYRIFGRR